MADLLVTPQAHHNWWAGLVLSGLGALRKVFRLNDQESAAWDMIVNLIETLS